MRRGTRYRKRRRHLRLALLGVVALAGASVALTQIHVSTPTTATTYSPASAPSVEVAASPTPQVPHLVVLGDSVPAGSGCECAGFGADLVGNSSTKLTNAAKPGLTTAGLLSQLNDGALDSALDSATIVTITIGANDFSESSASDSSCADLRCYESDLAGMTKTAAAIIDRIDALTPPNTAVVVTGYWNVFLDGAVGASKGPVYASDSDRLTRAVNTALAKVAATSNAVYADLYTPFKGAGTVDDTPLLAPDGDHPNVAGHAVIASAIRAALAAQDPPSSRDARLLASLIK